LKIKLNEANRFKRYFNLLAPASNVEICPKCDGAGGFTWDIEEQGAGGEECGYCDGAGIVDKSVS